MNDSIRCATHLLGFSKAVTQTSEAERACIAKCAAGCKSLVEIGVFKGVNIRILCESARQDATVYAVDPFFVGRVGVSFNRIVARRHVGDASGRRVVWIRDVSPAAASPKHVPPEATFDFAFIDGDHSYDAVMLDWQTWITRLAVGGHVALHDSRGTQGAGSERFTEERATRDPHFVTVETVDTLTVLKRIS